MNRLVAEKLSSVFAEARIKKPSLIFIDELDAVCPRRRMYSDSIAQEATAQLLEEFDGIGSDGQAVFICAATNRVDRVDSAMLSRFAERIEIPLPDEPTRRALLVRCSWAPCASWAIGSMSLIA